MPIQYHVHLDLLLRRQSWKCNPLFWSKQINHCRKKEPTPSAGHSKRWNTDLFMFLPVELVSWHCREFSTSSFPHPTQRFICTGTCSSHMHSCTCVYVFKIVTYFFILYFIRATLFKTRVKHSNTVLNLIDSLTLLLYMFYGFVFWVTISLFLWFI